MAKEKYRFSDLDAPAELAVIGLWPGGLAAALEAASLGKQVIAFSDRSDYIRPQRVQPDQDSIKFLSKFLDKYDEEDRIFFKRLIAEKTLQTKDLENFLSSKLDKFPNVKKIILEKPDKIEAVGNHNSDSYIKLSNGQKFFTKNILASDGARHNFAHLINQDLGVDTSYSPALCKNGIVIMRL